MIRDEDDEDDEDHEDHEDHVKGREFRARSGILAVG
jgi:hypothetical protein